MAYNIATAVAAGFMAGKLPRRPNLLIGLGAMAIFYIIWTVLSAINQQRNFEQTSLGEGVLAMIFLYCTWREPSPLRAGTNVPSQTPRTTSV